MKPKLALRGGVWHLECGYTTRPFSSRAEAIRNIPRITQHERVAQEKVAAAKQRDRINRARSAQNPHDENDTTHCLYTACRRPREVTVPNIGTFCKQHAEQARRILANPGKASNQSIALSRNKYY